MALPGYPVVAHNPVPMYADEVARRAETEYERRVRIALRAAAYYRGLANDVLASRVGVASNTVGRWMRGERHMSAEDAAGLTAALDAPPELFIRPPESREKALAMMAAYDELRQVEPLPDPSQL